MDPDDLDVLTPGHFLIGSSLLAVPEIPESNLALNDRFIEIQRSTQQFWKKWSADWLSHLQNRPKWHKVEPNLQLNDIVIMREYQPTNTWCLGRVVTLHPGEDNLIRVVTIRTQRGLFKRSISSLCKLPMSIESNKTDEKQPNSIPTNYVYQKPGLHGGAPNFAMKQTSKRVFNVIVEGNIGAGKSTLLNFIKTSSEIETVFEPVDQWRDLRGTNLLNLMYKNPEQWIYPFQSYALLTMLQNHEKVTKKRIKVMERSIFSMKNCFIEAVKLSNDKLSPVTFQIFDEWYQYSLKKSRIDVDLIIYLRTSPEVALHRISKRGRGEEAGVTLEYLQQLHELHDNWLLKNQNFKVMILDGDKDENEIIKEYERTNKKIKELTNPQEDDLKYIKFNECIKELKQKTKVYNALPALGAE